MEISENFSFNKFEISIPLIFEKVKRNFKIGLQETFKEVLRKEKFTLTK